MSWLGDFLGLGMTGAYPPSMGWERLIPETLVPIKTPKPRPKPKGSA